MQKEKSILEFHRCILKVEITRLFFLKIDNNSLTILCVFLPIFFSPKSPLIIVSNNLDKKNEF